MAKPKINKNSLKITSSRKETWMRLVVGVVSGIILCVWTYLIYVFAIINFVYGIFTGKRLQEIAQMCETWNTQMYSFIKYMTFLTNVRPFPFNKLVNNISKFE